MSIIRGPRPSDNYAQIHNNALADGRLSFKARGVLAYMLSRPPGWQTSVDRLAANGKDGSAAVKSALKELEQYGYLRRLKHRNSDGTFNWDQEVTDLPLAVQEELPSTDTISGLSTGGQPTDINNTELITLIQDGVVVNSPTESAAKRRGWWPSEAALASARDIDPITDIPIHVTRYRVVKAERKAQCDSAEWLRWFLEDEKKARAEAAKDEASRFRKKSWHDVAE